LLRENHEKISLIVGEDHVLNQVVVSLLWIASYTASLSG
jgi:hypothetical protein